MRAIRENLYDYLWIILIIILPFSPAVPNIILGILVLFVGVYYKRLNFYLLLDPQYVIVLGLISYLIVKAIINSAFFIEISFYSRLLFFLLIPILFLNVRKINNLYLGFVFSGLIATVLASFNLFRHYLINNNLDLFEGDLINRLLVVERPYLGLICVIAIVSAYKLSMSYKRYKYILYGYMFAVTLFILIISARISFLTLLFLLVILIFFYSGFTIKKKLLLLIAALTVVCGAIVFNKNMLDRFFIKDTLDKTLAQARLYEPRLIIWDCASETATEPRFNPVFGLDSNNTIEGSLTACYDKKIENRDRANFFVRSKFNTHNQFIGLYLLGGTIALLFMGSYFIYGFYSNKFEFVNISILISLLFFFMVENILQRQLGVYLFAILTCLIIRNQEERQKQDKLPN